MAEHCALDFRHKKTQLFIFDYLRVICDYFVSPILFGDHLSKERRDNTFCSIAPTFHNKKTKERYMAQVIFIVVPRSVEHHISLLANR